MWTALRVLMLCAPMFIFTCTSVRSALLGHPRFGLSIWLSLLAMFNTFFWVYAICFFFSRGNGWNTKILEVRHFRMIRKWPPTIIRCPNHYTEKARVQSEATIVSFWGLALKHGREPTRVSGNAHWWNILRTKASYSSKFLSNAVDSRVTSKT